MQENFVALNAYNFYLPFISIVILSCAVIIGFDCVWRAERKLDTFMKLLMLPLLALLLKKVLEIIGFSGNDTFKNFSQYLDLFISFTFLLAFGEMFRIIRALDGEEPPKNEVK